jgi:hypothetical protein
MTEFTYTDRAGNGLSMQAGHEDGHRIVRLVLSFGREPVASVDIDPGDMPAVTAALTALAQKPPTNCTCGTRTEWHLGNCEAL